MRKIARRLPLRRPSARRILVARIYAEGWNDRDAKRTAEHVPAPVA